MLKNLKISSKLYVGFGLVIALTLIIVGLNYNNYQSIQHSAHEAKEGLYPILKSANEMVVSTIQVQQWCTDISATQGKDGYDDGLIEAKAAADIFYAKLDELLLIDLKHREELNAMRGPFDAYYATGVKMANAYIKGGPDFGNTMMLEFDGASMAIQGLVNTYYETVEQDFNQGLADVEETTVGAITVNITVASIALLLAIAVAFSIARSIARPIASISKVAEAIATGDINHTIEVKSKDEIGQLGISFRSLIDYMQSMAQCAESIANNDLRVDIEPRCDNDILGHAFKKMTANLDGMIRQLTDNARELVSAATEIASSSEQMAQGAKNQTDQAAQVSSAIEQMSATIVESSRNANEAREVSESASTTSNEGQSIVGDTISGMVKIADSTTGSGQIIKELAEASDRIGEIIGVIDDIADQTNLLALNAAIEAARAGEQGRGFAVVADEVRKLAERTGKATGEITDMIKGIQSDSGRAVTSMEEAGKLVDDGKALADKAGNSLTEINSMSQRVTDMIIQIATAADQQSAAAEQISKNMEHITTIVRETATGAEQSASAAEELNRQAEGIQQMIGQFKLKEKV